MENYSKISGPIDRDDSLPCHRPLASPDESSPAHPVFRFAGTIHPDRKRPSAGKVNKIKHLARIASTDPRLLPFF